MNFLIQLSRNTKVMVPLVVAAGVAIFAGGAVINNNQKVARQNETQQTTGVSEQVAEVPNEVEQVEVTPEATEAPADEGATSEPNDVDVESTVTENMDGTVTVTAKLDTTESGVCTTTIQETEFTAVATNGTCEFKDLSIPVNAADLRITFTADQSGQTGSTRIE